MCLLSCSYKNVSWPFGIFSLKMFGVHPSRFESGREQSITVILNSISFNNFRLRTLYIFPRNLGFRVFAFSLRACILAIEQKDTVFERVVDLYFSENCRSAPLLSQIVFLFHFVRSVYSKEWMVFFGMAYLFFFWYLDIINADRRNWLYYCL